MIGLGNPGPKYKFTRHNIGFDWIDSVLSSSLFSAQSPKFTEKFNSLWWQGDVDGREIHFLKPQTYMNESGKALEKWSSKYQGLADHLIVFDDMDLSLGRLRLRAQGGDGGHRGLRSLINHSKGIELPRLRIGIGRPVDDSVDHVLQKFNPQEKAVVNDCLDDAGFVFLAILQSWFGGDKELALSHINGKHYGDLENGS